MHAVPPRPSLVTHSADFLRGALAVGGWEGVLPSERTLCQRLRISRPTLRAVLSQLEKEGVISAVKNRRRRVLAASEGGHAVARRGVIALLSPVPPQAMPPFVLFWLDALRELLAEAGQSLEVHASPHCYSAKPAGGLKKLTQRVQAATWVLFRSTPAMQRWFQEQALPVVVAGSCGPEVALPSVDLDYRATCRHAATLLRREGHARMALLLPDALHGGDAESELGFREALANAPGTRAWVIRHRESAEELVRQLDDTLRQKPAPTALLVARSIHTLTVVSHLLRQGLRIPRDIAVVSRDDDAFLDHMVPRITRYAADPAKFARRLARLVLDLAHTRRASTRPVRLMPDLKRGETA